MEVLFINEWLRRQQEVKLDTLSGYTTWSTTTFFPRRSAVVASPILAGIISTTQLVDKK